MTRIIEKKKELVISFNSIKSFLKVQAPCNFSKLNKLLSFTTFFFVLNKANIFRINQVQEVLEKSTKAFSPNNNSRTVATPENRKIKPPSYTLKSKNWCNKTVAAKPHNRHRKLTPQTQPRIPTPLIKEANRNLVPT
jgi:hypothetical protein